MHPTKSKILREPFRFHFLGSSELTLRRDFATQNARDAGLPAILFFPQRPFQIKTTSKLVVCTDPRRVITGRAPKGALKSLTPHYHYRPPLKRPVFMPTYSATRKRVDVFFHRDLIYHFILNQLIADILFDHPLVLPCRIYIITTAPEMSAAILIFQICVAIKNHQRAFSLEKPHKL